MKICHEMGIRIAGTNRDFLMARDAHPLSETAVSPTFATKKNLRPLFPMRFATSGAILFLCHMEEKHPKMTAFRDRL